MFVVSQDRKTAVCLDNVMFDYQGAREAWTERLPTGLWHVHPEREGYNRINIGSVGGEGITARYKTEAVARAAMENLFSAMGAGAQVFFMPEDAQ